MFDYSISFQQPGYLWLLMLLPVVWLLGSRSLAQDRSWRLWLAMAMRSCVLTLLVMALASPQMVRGSDRMTVLYLVDRSLSIPPTKLETIVEYVNNSMDMHRDRNRRDLAGVISFGRDAAMELPPLDMDVRLPQLLEAPVDAEGTDLAAALKFAGAVLPADSSARVVVISDGNQNAGDALAQARLLAERGVGIDVVPLEHVISSDVAVEKISLPAEVPQGTPFDVRVVLDVTGGEDPQQPVRGLLRVVRRMGNRSQTLSEQPVELRPGKQVLTLRDEIQQPNFYNYEARFVPEAAATNQLTRNDQAEAFTQVRGSSQVLLVENAAEPESFLHLTEALRNSGIEVTVEPSNSFFSNLAELQQYDAVVLANVARVSGADEVSEVSSRQVEMLVQNTRQLGAGLVMIGGPDSFGAGGWRGTPLEEAMPVDFSVKNPEVIPSGALLLVIDRSGSMSGEKIEICKAAAIQALRMLGSQDYLGVVAFDSFAQWIVPLTKVEDGSRIARRISRITDGGGTNMEPAMTQGYAGLRPVEAAIKHMIVLTDGQTEGSGFQSMAARAYAQGITTSAVAVGQGADANLLRTIANAGGGKYYFVDNPKTIPRIFMKEALRVARPVVFEDQRGIAVEQQYSHEILNGIQGQLPPITGYVMTTPKASPLVELSLVADRPTGQTNPVLASWQYGLGRSVAFTSDAGQRWTTGWNQWEGYDQIFSQMVRWAMRPQTQTGDYAVYTQYENGQVEVVVTATDSEGEFLNFLNLNGTALGPDLEPVDVPLTQTAPGRYTARFPADRAGSYFVAISPGTNQAPIRAGVNVPYSAEFSERTSNPILLEQLAQLTPRGGLPGEVIPEPVGPSALGDALSIDVFRGGLMRAVSRQDIWFWLVFLFACLFFLDVMNRRVQLSWDWVAPVLERIRARLSRRQPEPALAGNMARLQARKQEIGEQLETRRAAARFEAPTDAENQPAGSGSALQDELSAAAARSATASARTTPGQGGVTNAPAEEESYTSRLLKAKQQVWADRPKTDGRGK